MAQGEGQWLQLDGKQLACLSLTHTDTTHTHADTHIKILALGGPVFVCVLVVRPVI